MNKAHAGGRWGLLPAAAGAAWWVEKLVTVEWAYPYCGVLDNGEAAAVLGFPFPYRQASIVTSMTDFFIPWLYVVNLALITGVVFLLLRPPAYRLAAAKPRLFKFMVGPVAAFLRVTAVAMEVFALAIGVWLPTPSFSGSPPYGELRPVAVRVMEHPRNCTASPFWFPSQGARGAGRDER